ncbi:hypothetical protein BC938DRAFT_484286 [Jimgerdemannia flammicorona]|uniref:Uncharacterized protein n=1 Tax=Jimgerdemannia flammicorona TaxID=994334 RepID=A0A433QA79_9FUNG|nr:hypothetical protein BC938DRAFT_484286 [Jimgerdemannia flammicorona]
MFVEIRGDLHAIFADGQDDQLSKLPTNADDDYMGRHEAPVDLQDQLPSKKSDSPRPSNVPSEDVEGFGGEDYRMEMDAKSWPSTLNLTFSVRKRKIIRYMFGTSVRCGPTSPTVVMMNSQITTKMVETKQTSEEMTSASRVKKMKHGGGALVLP